MAGFTEFTGTDARLTDTDEAGGKLPQPDALAGRVGLQRPT